MTNLNRSKPTSTPGQEPYSATRLIGDPVVNPRGENLGKIENLVIDPTTGHVDYAVLSEGSSAWETSSSRYRSKR